MKILVIQIRGLGDAIITRNLLERISSLNTDYRFDILCSKHNSEVFENYKRFIFDFPVNKINKIFYFIVSPLLLIKLIIILLIINFTNYKYIIDPIGGKIERYLALLLPKKKLFSAHFYDINPLNIMFNKKFVGENNRSYYVFLYVFFSSIFNINNRIFHEFVKPLKRTKLECPALVGFSPFGGHPSRSLTSTQIYETINELGSRFNLVCYVSPQDLFRFNEIPDIHKCNITIKCITIPELLNDLKKLSLFIGVDSFLSHAAYYARVPQIFISSSNDFRIWSPPQSYIISSNDNLCGNFPCFNRPTCHGSIYEFFCIKSIPSMRIITLATKILS